MWIDSHVHLLESKKSRPDWCEINFTLKVAGKKGIDIICLTEHRDSLGFDELYSGIFGENKLRGHVGEDDVVVLSSGLMISPGAEISLKGGGDIGVHTNLKGVMNLRSLTMAYTAAEVLAELEGSASEYVTVAHHVLGEGKWWVEFEQVIQEVDAIEVPGKHPCWVAQYEELAEKFNKSKVSGSDAHTWIQLGVGKTWVGNFSSDSASNAGFINKLKGSIHNNLTVSCVSDSAREVLELSEYYRNRK